MSERNKMKSMKASLRPSAVSSITVDDIVDTTPFSWDESMCSSFIRRYKDRIEDAMFRGGFREIEALLFSASEDGADANTVEGGQNETAS